MFLNAWPMITPFRCPKEKNDFTLYHLRSADISKASSVLNMGLFPLHCVYLGVMCVNMCLAFKREVICQWQPES